MCSGQVGAIEVRRAQGGTSKARTGQVHPAQACTGKVRARQVHPCQGRIVEEGLLHFGALEVRTREHAPVEIGLVEPARPRRSGQVAIDKVRMGEIGGVEVCSPQVNPLIEPPLPDVGARQVRHEEGTVAEGAIGQVGIRQVCATELHIVPLAVGKTRPAKQGIGKTCPSQY